MKKFLFAVAAFTFLICLSGCRGAIDLTPYEQYSQADLEREKLAIELDALYRKEKYSDVTTFISVVGGVIGTVAVLWTIYQGYSTLKFQSVSQKQEQISNLLTSLSSNEPDIKIGAARGLTVYADDVINDVISAIATEDSFIVRNALEEVLFNISTKNTPLLFEINQRHFRECPYLIGRLIVLGASYDFIQSLFRLTDFSSKRLTRQDNRHLYDYGKMIESRNQLLIEELGKSKAEENLNLVTLSRQTTRVLVSTGNVIAKKMIENQHFKHANLAYPIHVSSTNMYNVNFDKINLSGSIFCNCLFRHAKFDEATLENCDFCGSDLYDASLDQTNFKGSNFDNVNLRSAAGKRTIFDDCNLSNTILSQCEFPASSFQKANLRHAKAKGSYLRGSKFNQTIFNQTEMHGAIFENGVFESCTFFGAKLIEANFKNSILRDCKFNGADLRGADFENAVLENAGFEGANLAGTNFNCKKLEANFTHAKNLHQAIFPANVEKPLP